MNCFWYHAFLIMMGVAAVNSLPSNGNNQANRQMQRATQGRTAPPPISLGRSTSPQQRLSSQHVVSPSAPTRQSPRLAAQRQLQAQHAAGLQGQTTAHPGTPVHPISRGQLAEQRRLQRQEQRGVQAQHAVGQGQTSVHPRTPANTLSRGQVAEQRRLHREEQRGLHQSTDLQTQAPSTRQTSLQGHRTTRTSIGVTPTRQRSNPAHGLRPLDNTGTAGPSTEEASGHRRAGSWVMVHNPPSEEGHQRIQAGFKTPTKKQ